jgi:hypothetical protein
MTTNLKAETKESTKRATLDYQNNRIKWYGCFKNEQRENPKNFEKVKRKHPRTRSR